MGTNLKDFVAAKEISLEDLNHKKLVVDSYNILYQFLSSIRQYDGTLLKDANGKVTSHLSGLFHRTTKLMSYGIKLAFVFDGVAPKLKSAERARRFELKKIAQVKYEIAKSEQDIDAMKKYAARISRLTPEIVDEAKELAAALGCPIVQAPSEAEAQAAFMVRNNDAFAVASEDYDSLIYGAPKLIKNLTITGRKKQKDRLSFETVMPCLIDLDSTLEKNGLSHAQLVVLSMLIGTDYNIGGIKGIGPKKAYKLVKGSSDFAAIFKALEWEKYFAFGWRDVFDLINNIPVKNNYTLEWKEINHAKIMKILVDDHGFNSERVQAALDKVALAQKHNQQKGLGEFLCSQ
ncbi:MAG: flap endonuclease-1 [Candidatus Woesearchaeota archaeon]